MKLIFRVTCDMKHRALERRASIPCPHPAPSCSAVHMSKSLPRPATAKDGGGNPRYDWTEAFYKTVQRDRSPVNMQMQLARPPMVAAARVQQEAAGGGRMAATLTRSKRPSTAMR